MLIALDYDGTYTADPVLWDAFICTATRRGHKVIIATMRFESEPIVFECEITTKILEIIYTGRIAKIEFLEKVGIRPNIWIDDKPGYIFSDS